VVRHGYDRGQVQAHLQRLEADLRQAQAERDHLRRQQQELAAQLDAARAEAAAARPAPTALEPAGQSGGDVRDERGARGLALARSQANEITARAQAAAEHTWAAAEQASVALRERYQNLLAELDRQHQEIHTAHEGIMAAARAKAEEMTTAAERRRAAIDAEAERDRVRIDREFSESVNAKREALREEIEARRAAAEAEADKRVREATQEADRRLTSANAELDRLTALRDQLAAQLRDTHQLVERVTATLAPADQELNFEDTLLFPAPVPIDDKPAR